MAGESSAPYGGGYIGVSLSCDGRTWAPLTVLTTCSVAQGRARDHPVDGLLIERRHGGMHVPREVIDGFEPKDVDRMHVAPEELADAAAAGAGGAPPCVAERGAASLVPGVVHSRLGLAHDRMHGGVKGRRKSKKDKLREQHAAAARGGARG